MTQAMLIHKLKQLIGDWEAQAYDYQRNAKLKDAAKDLRILLSEFEKSNEK